MLNPFVVEQVIFEQHRDKLGEIGRHQLYRQMQASKTKRLPQIGSLVRAIVRRWFIQVHSKSTLPAMGRR